MAAPRVSVYSANDLKSTTDDALPPYLCTLPQPYTFKQDHTSSNVRFALGYSAVAIAGATFYVDRQLGWEATKAPWVLVVVILYFILNSILTYWIWAIEAGEVFKGVRKSGETITIRSFSQKHSPIYKLKIKYASQHNKRVLQEKEIESSFTRWFSSDGIFHADQLRKWLAGEIEILGLAAKEAAKKGR